MRRYDGVAFGIQLEGQASLKAKLEKLAKHDRRTLSAYVEKLLERSCRPSGWRARPSLKADADDPTLIEQVALKAARISKHKSP
jgi:hypothetical protein